MADYLLVFDPVELRVAYLKLSPIWLEEGEPAALGRVIFSSFDLPSGAARVRELSRKWYRIDVKMLASLAPRYAVERYAPVYEVRLPVPCGASVDMMWGYLTVVWGVPARAGPRLPSALLQVEVVRGHPEEEAEPEVLQGLGKGLRGSAGPQGLGEPR
jgi:hypothetical protein